MTLKVTHVCVSVSDSSLCLLYTYLSLTYVFDCASHDVGEGGEEEGEEEEIDFNEAFKGVEIVDLRE